MIEIEEHKQDFKSWMVKKAGLSKSTATMYYKYISRSNTLPYPWEKPSETINVLKELVTTTEVKAGYRKLLAYLEQTNSLTEQEIRNHTFVENRLEKITVNKKKGLSKKEVIQKYLTVPQVYRFKNKIEENITPSRLSNFYENDELERGCFEFKILPLFLFETGARISEALQLKVEDVNFEKGKVEIRHGKGDKFRVVSINRTQPDVHRLAKCFEGTDLFLTELGRHYSKIRYEFVKWGKKFFDRKVNAHWFRHSWATNWAVKRIRQGASKGDVIEEIRDYLGHDDRKTSEIYIHAAEELIQKNVYSQHGGFEKLEL